MADDDFDGVEDTEDDAALSAGVPSFGINPMAQNRDAAITSALQDMVAARARKNTALQDMKAGNLPLTGAEVGVTALSAIIPLLIGAGVAGKRGFYGAAGPAHTASTGYLAQLQAQREKTKADAKISLAAAQADEKGASIVSSGLMRDKFKAADPSKNNINNNINVPSPVANEIMKDQYLSNKTAAAGQFTLDEVAKLAPDYLTNKKAYVDENGNVNYGAMLESNLDAIGAKLAGPSTQRSQIESMLQSFVNDYRKNVTGAAASEKELLQIEGVIKGTNWGATDIAGALKNVEMLSRRAQNQARVGASGISGGKEVFKASGVGDYQNGMFPGRAGALQDRGQGPQETFQNRVSGAGILTPQDRAAKQARLDSLRGIRR